MIFKVYNGEILLLELSVVGFYWEYRKDQSKKFPKIDPFHISDTFRQPVKIDYVKTLIREQKDRCYAPGSLFSYSEFATTMFKLILAQYTQRKEAEAAKATEAAKLQEMNAAQAQQAAEDRRKKKHHAKTRQKEEDRG